MCEASVPRSATFMEDDDKEVEFLYWIEHLRCGLCLPQTVIDEARYDFDTLTLLEKVKEWLLNAQVSSQRFDLPVYGWGNHLKTYFDDVPNQEYEEAERRFPRNEYGQWRHLALHVLKNSIQKLKTQPVLTGPHVSATSETFWSPDTLSSKLIGNFKPLPTNFKRTENFLELQKTFANCAFLHLYGERLCGKSYYVSGLVHDHYKTTQEELTISWLVDCDQDEFSYENEFETIGEYLKNKGEISSQDLESMKKDLNSMANNLLDLLLKKKTSVVLAFENVRDKHERSIHNLFSVIQNLESSSNAQVKVIVTTRGGKNRFRAERMQGLEQWCVETYTDKEAVDYVMSHVPEVVSYNYYTDNRKITSASISTKNAAKELAKYFKNNPGCLHAAVLYCLTRKLTIQQYVESIKVKASRDSVLEAEVENMEATDGDDAKAFQALRKLTLFDDACNDDTKRMAKVLNVLSFVEHERIPIDFIGKICQSIRPKNKKLTSEEVFQLNRIETSDVIYRMEEIVAIEYNINYPDGEITIPKYVSDALRVDPVNGGEDLMIALETMAKMTSKDTTKSKANEKLLLLRPHINELTNHASLYFQQNFDVEDKKKDSFKVAMLLCRLFEVLAHAHSQGRIQMTTISPLDMLFNAATLVWKIVTTYNTSVLSTITSAFCFLKNTNDCVTLEYNETQNAQKEGESIADICTNAGRKVGSETLMEYWKASISFNMQNYEDFVHNATEKMNGQREKAEEKLKSIKNLVEKALPCNSSDIKILRETENLLSAEQLENSFFAERLSSIFHTLGRQVVYLQDDLPDIDQKKCEYYMKLAHHIAKSTREKTGVALLNEYITIANGKVPRMLQNQKHEPTEERNARLREYYFRSRELPNVTLKYYENACFRRVRDTGYTHLNAQKYMVKANTKILKHSSKAISESAVEECKELLKLARENSSQDQSSHCFINAARFFAATEHFQEAFQAFNEGFNFKNPQTGDRSGVFLSAVWREDTAAWAVHNYCRAVDAYSKQTNGDLERKRARAAEHCINVLRSYEITEKWQNQLKNWLEKFESG